MLAPLVAALGMTALLLLVDELTRYCVRPHKTNV
jgi:hypothetical protein